MTLDDEFNLMRESRNESQRKNYATIEAMNDTGFIMDQNKEGTQLQSPHSINITVLPKITRNHQKVRQGIDSVTVYNTSTGQH